MTHDECFGELLARLRAADGNLLIQFNEIQSWPVGLFESLCHADLLMAAPPAQSIACGGCEEACSMPVHIIPGDYPRAFVMCDKRDDIGRVFVTMDELQQWRMTDAAIGRTLLAACDC